MALSALEALVPRPPNATAGGTAASSIDIAATAALKKKPRLLQTYNCTKNLNAFSIWAVPNLDAKHHT